MKPPLSARLRGAVIGSAVILSLTSCKVGPTYYRPSAFATNDLPTVFLEAATNGAASDWKTAEPAAHLKRSD